jgi:uncharacterized protein (DUF2342 family)
MTITTDDTTNTVQFSLTEHEYALFIQCDLTQITQLLSGFMLAKQAEMDGIRKSQLQDLLTSATVDQQEEILQSLKTARMSKEGPTQFMKG